MRKFILFLSAAALLFCLCTGVSAANSISSAQAAATVSSDGSCQVSMTMTIHLEQTVDKITFPVPENATSISLNGSRVRAPRSDGARQVDLSRLLRKLTGDLSFSIQYSLRDVIHTTEAGTLELQLPLLCGFQYTIETMSFTVTLPGGIDVKPAFSSGYHKSSIEASLSNKVEGMTITGSTLKPLKDHETLVMTLPVTEQMFPQSIVKVQNTNSTAVAMGICGALALLYWLLTLRCFPTRKQHTPEPPEGYNAGSLGSILALQGIDLSLTVLSWAQLGYLTIHPQRGRKVLLTKNMNMGNERSPFEQRCFQRLFGKKQTVDTSSLAFAQLWRSMDKKCAPIGELIHPRTGNLNVFRGLAAGIGLFGGAGIGLVMGSGAVLQILLVVVMAALGALSGWATVGWGASLGLRNKAPLQLGVGLSILWLLLGLICGEFVFALWMVVGLMLAGVLLRLAGLRTELGRQTAAQVAGFRHYLRTQNTDQLRKRCEADPDYFFRMVPYAIALDADKSFAKAFGNIHLGECPYVVGGPGEGLTARVWCEMLKKIVSSMEGRAKQLPMEQFKKFLRSLKQR